MTAPDSFPPSAPGPLPPLAPPALEPALTAIVLRPGAAIGLGVYCIVLNIGLRFATRSTGVVDAAHVLIGWVGGTFAVSPTEVAAVISGVITLVAYGLVLLPTVLIARERGVRFRDAVGLRPLRIGPVIGAALVATVLAFCLVVPYGIALQGLGIDNPGNTIELVLTFGGGPVGVAILFVLGAFVAPFVEEVTFRGIVYASLRTRWRAVGAVAFSSALFGLAHLDVLMIIPTALIGALFAVTFAKTRSLWASIAAHGAYNGFVLAMALLLAKATG